jgi:putative MATE family efflux protein
VAARDLTQGSVARTIPVLASSMLLLFAMNSLYALADLFFVSRLGGAALAGLSISLNTFLTVVGVGQAIGAGGLALMSQAYGAGRHGEARAVFQQVVWLMLVAGLSLWLLGYLNAERFIRLFSTEEEVVRQGTAFLKAYSATFFLQVVLIASAMGFRAVGDFTLPTVISSATVLLNLALDPLLIFGWGPVPAMGIAGAGVATALGQGAGVLVYAGLALFGHRRSLLVVRGPLRWEWGRQAAILRIGVPAGLRVFLLGVNVFFAFWFLRPLGGDSAAATGLGMRIVQALIGLFGDSIGTAVASIVGQNHGAGRAGRVQAAIGWGLGYYTAAFVAIYALILWNPIAWVALFAKEAAIQTLAARYLVIVGAALPFFGLSLMTAYASFGLGRSFPSMLAALVNLGCCVLGWGALRAATGMTTDGLWLVAMAALDIESLIMAGVLVWLWRQQHPEAVPSPAAEPG